MARVPEMMIHRRSVRQVSELGQTQTQFVLAFSCIVDVRLARRGKRRASKKGGGSSWFFKTEVSSVFNPV